MQITSATPRAAHISLATPDPAELLAAKILVDSIFQVPSFSNGRATGTKESAMYFGPDATDANQTYFGTDAVERDPLQLNCATGRDPWEARESVAGVGALRLIRNFQTTGKRARQRELPLVPMHPINEPSIHEMQPLQDSPEFITKATGIILWCVNQAMEDRILQFRYERFLERSMCKVSTFIPNSDRLASAYKRSRNAKASSPSFAYRGSLLGAIRGRISAAIAERQAARSNNPLDRFEMQPNFEKGKNAESRRYQDNIFLPNWHQRGDAAPRRKEIERAQSEEVQRLQLIEASQRTAFLPNSRRQTSLTTVPLWIRNSWKKTIEWAQ